MIVHRGALTKLACEVRIFIKFLFLRPYSPIETLMPFARSGDRECSVPAMAPRAPIAILRVSDLQTERMGYGS